MTTERRSEHGRGLASPWRRVLAGYWPLSAHLCGVVDIAKYEKMNEAVHPEWRRLCRGSVVLNAPPGPAAPRQLAAAMP